MLVYQRKINSTHLPLRSVRRSTAVPRESLGWAPCRSCLNTHKSTGQSSVARKKNKCRLGGILHFQTHPCSVFLMKGCSGNQSHSWVGMSLHRKKAILILQIVGSTQFSLVTTPLLWWIVNPIFILYGIVWGLVAVFCSLMLHTFLLTSFVLARARSYPKLLSLRLATFGPHVTIFISFQDFRGGWFSIPICSSFWLYTPVFLLLLSCCHVLCFGPKLVCFNWFQSPSWLRPHWLSVRGSSVPCSNPTRQWKTPTF